MAKIMTKYRLELVKEESHKYEVEREELKKKILELNQNLSKISHVRDGKEHFLSCVRRFAEMNEITPMILHELK